ncbi:MAG: hypothetical protein ACKKMS_03385 [Candidatus Nealsonbacteria bacterium]
MKYPDLKIKFQNKTLTFQFLGQFEIERDEKGTPITYERKNQEETSYLLSVRTELTKSGKPEVITILPNHLRTKLKRKYYDTKNLGDIWRLPGIYAFILTKDNNVKYKYIGRASIRIANRLRQYLAPSSKRMTTFYVNRLLFKTLKEGDTVLIYFYPEPDTEKELQILLRPDWNREIPRNN